METIGLKETSRRCTDVKCGAKLRDTVLDWEVFLVFMLCIIKCIKTQHFKVYEKIM